MKGSLMAQTKDTCKPILDYPCKWLYKVIGSDQKKLQQAIKNIIGGRPCEISMSNTSSSGKYLCLNLELTVSNEEERNSIYLNLKAHPHVKIVL